MPLPVGTNEWPQAVAIIGMGCRVPGAVGVEAFWQNLIDGRESIIDYPGGRFPALDRIYTDEWIAAGRTASRRGGFLRDIDQFDAQFFGISPREAELLDPQQRLLLETCWQAIEDAGIPRERLAGSATGVYTGVWTGDYEHCTYGTLPELDFYSTTGGGRYPISGRLSYLLDLRGPSLTVDTACSSSLVAIHLACQAIRSGECSLAIAGGVNVILGPEVTLIYSAAGMLSPDGRCKFGDAAADGYVRSEGAALLVLKPLDRALADRDRIYAVIRGSAVNNDGQSSGLLISPSPEGQRSMFLSAMADAGIEPQDVDYVEAHGTGTAAGDPVEIGVIGRIMAETGRTRPCYIGSVKTNIGHTESAAGAAGAIKVALALHHEMLPASLNCAKPTPAIPWAELPIRVANEAIPWPAGGPGIAGVSGFGITGTNAHVVLQKAPPSNRLSVESRRPHLIALSAHTDSVLRTLAREWVDRLAGGWNADLGDCAYSAGVRRTHHQHRLAVLARNPKELEERLSGWLAGETAEGVRAGTALGGKARVAMIFPGQGGQWAGMGRQLWQNEPVFRARLEQCDEAIRKVAGWSVIEQVIAGGSEDQLRDIDQIQPALWALMVSLAELWRSYGIEPAAVAGHSMGEAAAAVVAGALSLEDGAAVICERSRLMRVAGRRGAMAVTELSREEAESVAATFDGRLSIAAFNSPSSIVFSGDTDAIETLVAGLQARETFAKLIKVDVASHCSHMDAIRGELQDRLAAVSPRDGTVAMFSTTSGRLETGSGLDARYWGRNLREPVQFASAVEQMLDAGCDTFIEINAHPVLLHAIQQSVRARGVDAVTAGSLRRDADEQSEMLASLATLYANGYPVDFRRLYPEGNFIGLPLYGWQRERYWIDAPRRQALSVGRAGRLNGQFVSPFSPDTTLWRAEPADVAHGIVEVLVEAGLQLAPSQALVFEDLMFPRPGQEPQEVQVAARAVSPNEWDLRCVSQAGETTITLAAGKLRTSGTGGDKTEKWRAALAAAFQTACGAVGLEPDESRIGAIARFAIDTGGRASVDGLAAEPRVLNGAGILYELDWMRDKNPLVTAAPGSWIVVSNDEPAADRLAAELLANGQECSVLRVTGDSLELPEAPVAAIVCLFSRQDEPKSSEEFLSRQLDSCAAASTVVREIAKRNSARSPRLWLVSSGSMGPDHDGNFVSASLWGLGRVIAREHPELRCVNVDLDPESGTESWDTLLRLLLSKTVEDEIAIRRGERFVARYQSAENTGGSATIVSSATYLITGGTGGIGLTLADWLVRKGARFLALLGRREPDATLLEAFARLERAGAQIRYLRADVADIGRVQEVVEELSASMPPIKGVFHLAVHSEAALLRDINYQQFSRVLAPKALGAWNLHRATEKLALDHFVLFSSIAAVWSQPGQGTYAAANAILDGLARYRRARGLPATSVEFGPWQDVGMANRAQRTVEAYGLQGVRPIPGQLALDALERAIGSRAPVTLAVLMRWCHLAAGGGAEQLPHAFVSLIRPAAQDLAASGPGLRERLASIAAGRQRELALEKHLCETLAAVLRTSAARVDAGRPMGSMGVDSLMALEFVRRLGADTGLKLPATSVFNYPTIHTFSIELMRRLELNVTPAEQVASESAVSVAVAEISEEEALRELMGSEARK